MCSPINLDTCIKLYDHMSINTSITLQKFPQGLLEFIPSPYSQPMITTGLYYVLILLSFHNTICVCAQLLNHVRIFVVPQSTACQVSLSMEFSRQEYSSWLSFPTPEGLPDPGTQHTSLVSPALADGFFLTTLPPSNPVYYINEI